MTAPASVLVVGTGLIGTSVALALHGSTDVLLDDADPGHLEEALAQGAGRRWQGERVDLAVVATPPATVVDAVVRLQEQGAAAACTHVASAQAPLQRDVERRAPDPAAVCGGHPLAGREVRGPGGATARLFLDRPWVLCPGASTATAALEAVRWLATTCGAVPLELPPGEHDRLVALSSHLPQVVASALAATLAAGPDDGGAPARLAGPALQDMTRIAASDPSLWVEVLDANAAEVGPVVRELAQRLLSAADALDGLAAEPGEAGAAAAVRALLELGNRGRALVPGKAPGATELVPVAVVVRDEPGQLAALFDAAAAGGVNVEDVRVEHLRGRARGVVQLLVAAPEVEAARTTLAGAGWELLGA